MEFFALSASLVASLGFLGVSASQAFEEPKIEPAKFAILDLDGCEKVGNCFYQNASNPYGRTVILDGRTLLLNPDPGLGPLDQFFGAFLLDPNQALVVIGPAPNSRYWSGIIYLFRDGRRPTALELANDNTLTEKGAISFSSLSQGFSNFQYPGVEKIAIIISRNQNVYAREKNRIERAFPGTTPIPLWVPQQAPLGAPLSFVFRTALFPEGEINNFISTDGGYISYRSTYKNIGFSPTRYVLPGTDPNSLPVGILPIIPQIAPLEPSELPLSERYNQYIALTLKNYEVVREIPANPAFLNLERADFFLTSGYDCISRGYSCQADNPQAAYISTQRFSIVEGEAVLITAVNHNLTQRAFYSNVVIYDDDLKFGIDAQLADSKNLFYNHLWTYEAGIYRIIERAYVALPQTTVGPDARTLLLVKIFIVKSSKPPQRSLKAISL